MDMDRESRVSMEHGMMADSDCESDSGFRKFQEFPEIRMVKLDECEGEHGVIQTTFLGAMGFIGNEINLVSIHKNSHSSVKLEAFRIFSQAVAARRGGDANVKLGDSESFSHGVGIYLSPVNLPIGSALRAEEDENGVRHMLMCRVILGNTETIPPASKQLQPSCTDFDSGIDNPLEPTKYIIWTAYMNTHIFPAYIISFTLPGWGRRNWSSSPSMKFQVLMRVLSGLLPPTKMRFISNYYNEFQANKIDRPQFITRLRSFVGDKKLKRLLDYQSVDKEDN
ncbi:hypothetical protein ACS0TY_010128 [Phlomoides rotata]